LMTREIAHQKSFEKALYAIEPNFPAGKLPGDKRYTNTYYNMSQGEGDMRGSWNQGEQWQYIDDREKQAGVDGKGGISHVDLSSAELALQKKLQARTMSNPAKDPVTGAELGSDGINGPKAVLEKKGK